jgi:hypothetical protein
MLDHHFAILLNPATAMPFHLALAVIAERRD